MKFLISIFILAAVSGFAQPARTAAQAKHPLTFEDMMSLKRLSEPVPSPDGKWIVFGAEDGENKRRDEELEKSKVKAKIFSRLFYRHWKALTEFKRSLLFVMGAAGSADILSAGQAGVSPAESQSPGKMPGGPTGRMPVLQPRDLTPGDHDVPPFSLGGQDSYAVSPTNGAISEVRNPKPQIPRKLQAPIFQCPFMRPAPEVWILKILWRLGFGIWCL